VKLKIQRVLIQHQYLFSILLSLFVITLAIGTQSGTPYNRTAVDFGFAQITWYAIFILTGIFVALFLSANEMKKLKMNTEFLYDGILWALPLSILGARLYYVLFDPLPHYQSFIDVINISKGGLAIHGAVIIASLFTIFYTRKKKMNIWIILDILAIGFLVGQILGRFGNFMNHEAYGPSFGNSWIMSLIPNFITNQMTDGTIIHQPTFLYEGLWNFLGLSILLFVRRRKILKIGDMFGLYLIWYGLGRGLIIEPLRVQGAYGDSLMIFGYPVNIYMSLIGFVGLGLTFIIIKNLKKNNLPYYVDIYKLEKTVDYVHGRIKI